MTEVGNLVSYTGKPSDLSRRPVVEVIAMVRRNDADKALGLTVSTGVHWFWIGTHGEVDKIVDLDFHCVQAGSMCYRPQVNRSTPRRLCKLSSPANNSIGTPKRAARARAWRRFMARRPDRISETLAWLPISGKSL